MRCCRAEVPNMRIGVSGQQCIAAHFIPRPLAYHGRGDVANIVDVVTQQSAELGVGERHARPAEAVVVQPAEVDPLFEVDAGMARCRNGTIPVIVRLYLVWRDDLRI